MGRSIGGGGYNRLLSHSSTQLISDKYHRANVWSRLAAETIIHVLLLRAYIQRELTNV